MNREKFIPPEARGETRPPLIEKADMGVETLQKFFIKVESADEFACDLAPKLDEIFIKEVPAMPESSHSKNQVEAQRKILKAIEQIEQKRELSPSEKETMNKLAEYFTDLVKRSECAEHAKIAIGFLEHIPSENSVTGLEKLSHKPLEAVNLENKNIRYYEPAVEKIRQDLGSGAPTKDVVKEYVMKIVQPEAKRAVIKLKEKMGKELNAEEQRYLEEHSEKF